MKIWKWILLSIIIISTGCSLNQVSENSQNNEEKQALALPWFVAATPSNTKEYVYGMGQGENKEVALAEAKKSIEEYYRNNIKSQLQIDSDSLESNLQEAYQVYYQQQLKKLRNLDISGITHLETQAVGDSYYTLARLEKALFDNSQNNIINEINAAIRLGNQADNPGLKLQSYYLATSFLNKLNQPLNYGDQNAFIYLARQINQILSNLSVAYTFSDYSDYSDYQSLKISIKVAEKPLTAIPLLIGEDSYYPNQDGIYFVKCKANQPYKLNLKIDIDQVKLYPGLKGEEVSDAKELIQALTPWQESIEVKARPVLKAFVKVSHFINNQESLNLQLINQIKNYLLEKNISLASSQTHANLLIEVTSNVGELSENSNSDITYRAWGSMTIIKDGQEKLRINLDDEATKEKTQTSAQNALDAARQAREKLNSLVLESLQASSLLD
jgi:hypothetical protein